MRQVLTRTHAISLALHEMIAPACPFARQCFRTNYTERHSPTKSIYAQVAGGCPANLYSTLPWDAVMQETKHVFAHAKARMWATQHTWESLLPSRQPYSYVRTRKARTASTTRISCRSSGGGAVTGKPKPPPTKWSHVALVDAAQSGQSKRGLCRRRSRRRRAGSSPGLETENIRGRARVPSQEAKAQQTPQGEGVLETRSEVQAVALCTLRARCTPPHKTEMCRACVHFVRGG